MITGEYFQVFTRVAKWIRRQPSKLKIESSSLSPGKEGGL